MLPGPLLRPALLSVLGILALAAPAGADENVLRWGGDAEGGAPFVEADPADPRKVVGFDVEIAELIARGLGRTPRFVQVAFASIDQSVAARRLRHRPERHRGHAGAARRAGRHDARTTSSARC